MSNGDQYRKAPIHLSGKKWIGDPEIQFLTICTKDRKPILAKADIHALLLESWQQAGTWVVGRYVILPDHIHLFCAPASHTAPSLTNWVKFWKSHASRQWPRPSEQPVWQQQFWDTQMRKSESYSVKWDYVKNNPVRHGLVKVAEDWPFQGEPNLV